MRTGYYVDTDAREHYRDVLAAVATAAPEHSVEDVDTPFGRVRVRRFPAGHHVGATAPWLLVPGTGAPGLAFADLVPALSARREVLLVDPLGGPGDSRQDVPLRRFTDQVRWLAAMIEGLGPDAVHLAGSSMGGRHALGLAATGHPSLRSLALLEPVATFTRIPARTMVAAIGALPRAPGWWRRRYLEAVGVDPDGPGADAALFAAGLDRYAVAAPHPPVATDAELGAVAASTLVLLGGRSALLDADRAARRARARLSAVRVEVWPEATHAILNADPARLVDALVTHADTADAAVAPRVAASPQRR